MADKRPTAAVLFTSSADCSRKQPFSKNKSRVYRIFSERAKKHGLDVVFSDYREYSGGKLKCCWHLNNSKWELSKNREIDVVYSRFAGAIYRLNEKNREAERLKYRMADEITMVNHPALDEFCWDKKIIAELFPEHTPKTFLINTRKGMEIVLPEIKSERIVIKPRYGSLGKDVIIADRKNLPEKIKKNTIVQEFIDTSRGIKELVNKAHDLRILMINGKADHSHIRIPKKGLLAANMALGGKKIFIGNGQIPKKAMKIAKKVDRVLRNFYPRIYSVDFVFDERGRPYIVECNSQPIIDRYAFGKYAKVEFYDRVVMALKSGIRIKVLNRKA